MLFTIQQVAEILNVSESSVRRLEQSGELKSEPFATGHCRFSIAEIHKARGALNQTPKQNVNTRCKMSVKGVEISKIQEVIDKSKEQGATHIDIVIEEKELTNESNVFDSTWIFVGCKSYGCGWMVGGLRHV